MHQAKEFMDVLRSTQANTVDVRKFKSWRAVQITCTMFILRVME